MIQKADRIAALLEKSENSRTEDPLVICPQPDLEKLRTSGSASVDLRLGCWLASMRGNRLSLLEISGKGPTEIQKLDAEIRRLLPSLEKSGKGLAEIRRLLPLLEMCARNPSESEVTKSHYVPFGRRYLLHPRSFVLGITLEWIRLPSKMAGYVIGKSSLGRRGLIIATATGVHPGFTGCLTLEISNVGEVPISLRPGMRICQIFLHKVESRTRDVDKTGLMGQRKPILGSVSLDPVADQLGSYEGF